MSEAAIEALVILAAKYGPELAVQVAQLWQKKGATLDDFITLFKDLKPYSAFGIPSVPPK